MTNAFLFRILSPAGASALLGVACTPAPSAVQAHRPAPSAIPDVVVCDSYLRASGNDPRDVASAACTKLNDAWTQACDESKSTVSPGGSGPGCVMALWNLMEDPACRAHATSALCSDALPRDRRLCASQRHSGLRPDPVGAIGIVMRQSVSSNVPVESGVMGVAVDGIGALVANVTSANVHTQGPLGSLKGRLEPGQHAVQLYVRLRHNQSFDGFGQTVDQCITVRDGVPLHVTAILEDSKSGLADFGSPRARLEAE